MMDAALTLGPVLFHWPADDWRDFYLRIADEAPVDTVYLGEVVCAKRAPLVARHAPAVVERLEAAGKRVVLSSLAEIMTVAEVAMTADLCLADDRLVEANDAAALYHLRGRPHAVGPFVNLYNEETLALLAAQGAVHATLPPELPATAVARLAGPAARLGVGLEVQIYGRIPLALSARCYHARAHGRTKDSCRFVCEEDPDGMPLRTLDDQPFLAVNGVQTLSHGCLMLTGEVAALQAAGVGSFRLSPQRHDMVAVARLYRDLLDGCIAPADAASALTTLRPDLPPVNGFHHGRAGHLWVEAPPPC